MAADDYGINQIYNAWDQGQKEAAALQQQRTVNQQNQQKIDLEAARNAALADYYKSQADAMNENADIRRQTAQSAQKTTEAQQAYPILSMVANQPDDISAAAAWDSIYDRLPDSVKGVLPQHYDPNMLKGYLGTAARDKIIAGVESNKYKSDRALEGKEATGAYSLERQKIANQGAQAVAAIRAANKAGVAAPPKTYQAAAVHYQQQYEQSGDPRDKDLADFYLNAAQQAKTIPVGPTYQEGQIVTAPKAQTQPAPVVPSRGQQSQQQPSTNKASLADVQKMYPGIPTDKLKEAYKKKFGVDLQ